ncbi:MAG: ABC transporter ATP-binding protein [Actinobacteria bacterium]|nr:ABC transporter ATP-binding protein [Actinomycetota bacterium]
MGDVVVANGLRKRFRNTVAVDGLDLTVAAGERVGLLGANGAGKTTTLLMLLGAVSPDEGTIEILGCRLPRGRSKAMQGVGFAAGYLPLPDRLRVHEVLTMFGNLYGVDDPKHAVAAGLERFRIAHLANVMGAELSSGQRTLVGIVRATMHRPPLLILDEPTASLDPDVAQRVRIGLRELCEEDGIAMLTTSHNMVEVERMCERVLFMKEGRIIAEGSPSEVAASYGHADLEAVFLELYGEPAPHDGTGPDGEQEAARW